MVMRTPTRAGTKMLQQPEAHRQTDRPTPAAPLVVALLERAVIGRTVTVALLERVGRGRTVAVALLERAGLGRTVAVALLERVQ
jgi:hypothetical protein